ncbi:serine/threonine protein kinase [Xylanibacter rodentium]|uniref:serine/threonine protein kinase n=1 Tax=Xylanibacter rodentium TaxID=2736289 RepID=UPI0025962838|nr:serine/threonine-protein kinase [Xylanibacter rodentium]
MRELKSGDKVNLTNGTQAKIIKELGRGGQGIVYLVDLAGKQMALKWYLKAPDNKFYKNLEENISKGAPSDAFLWPEYLTRKEKGSYGYIMKLRPQGYYEFGQYLLAKRQFGSFEAMLNAAMKICEGFYKLHLSGLSYQDLNDGNFFIEPKTGDVLICDNDNVMPDGRKSGIMGKARYMAPEVVGGKAPDKYSDRFSLAVILFMLFYGNHPFEGSRVLACPCMTESFEKKFYGSDILFIYDENKENRPVRGVHNNVIRRWPAMPQTLQNAFKEQFGKDILAAPDKRMIEKKWKGVIQSLRDTLVRCPKCGDETFVSDSASPVCMNCGKSFDLAGKLVFINGREILLSPNTMVYIDDDNQPDIKVVSIPGDKYPVQLQNITKENWVVETQSGKIKSIEPGACVPIRPGLKLSIGSLKSEIQ